MWSDIIKKTKQKKVQSNLKKKIKTIEKLSTINSPNDYFEVRHTGDLLDYFISLEKYFDDSIISILNRNGVKKEYDFIELVKNNILLKNNDYDNYLQLFESDEEFSDDDIICK